MEIASSMIVPIIPTFHTEGNSCRRRIRTGVLASGVPGSVIGSQGLTGKDVMLESTTSEILVVFKRHDDGGDDDENSSWTTSFFYLPRSRTIPEVV